MGTEWITFVVPLGAGFLLGRYVPWFRARAPQPSDANRKLSTSTRHTVELLQLANALEQPIEGTAHPSALLDLPEFLRGVTLVLDDARSASDIMSLVKGDNWIISCMAGEALCRADLEEDLSDNLLSQLRFFGPWPLYFVLKYLLAKESRALLGQVIVQATQWWTESAPMMSLIAEFANKRLAVGERATFAGQLDRCTAEEVTTIAAFLNVLEIEPLGPMLAEIEDWQSTYVDVGGLNAIGRVWPIDQAQDVVRHSALLGNLDRLQSYLDEPSYRSVLLVGETGVGKTSLVRVLASRMQESGWTLFEAGATDVLAGQVYVGELEGRLKTLLDEVGISRRVIWYAPDFHVFLHAGSHRHDPAGLVDRILPSIEGRKIVVLGETTPEGYGRLVQNRPRLRSAMDTLSVASLSDPATLEVARQWAELQGTGQDTAILEEHTIAEALSAVKQCLTDKGAPGSLLDVLQTTRKRMATRAHAIGPLSISDVLATLSQTTGLPQAIIDDRQDLNIESLLERFQERIIGQAEAVNSIVERVAMLKAGLNDPMRPLGVFLFVGPTGTGKTEIAKTLARFLFGSEERMIRLDMSEFQTLDSMDRILGHAGAQTSDSLVDIVRKQPFSVVLLDEFEKAHPRIWDLLLQVFDDGRLTDRSGNLGNFRHSIIILTSNLGARIASGRNIGFALGGVSFSRSAVEREVKAAFRPEFINRIDRIVVFHPLSRDVMQKILRRELDDVLGRRGFRKRDWAVEWDESAVEFLLHKGFTPDLGARPLRRAVERYLLSPLAMTIVKHEFPEGDQFLFITSNGAEIAAEFVDPDAPLEQTQDAAVEAGTTAEARDVRLLALDARGSLDEYVLLKAELERIEQLTEEQDWQTMKRNALAKTGAQGFWDIPERFEILSKIEVMDRIESGLRGAKSLLQRLSGSGLRARAGYSPELLKRLAEQLHLRDTAYADFRGDRPYEAFVLVDSHRNPHVPADLTIDFFRQINQMYIEWAKKRRMRYRQLQMQIGGADRCRSVIAVSGFGAFSILAPETGLHLFETPKENRAFEKCKVRVRVVPGLDEPAKNEGALLEQAERMFALTKEGTPHVVRHYRAQPSPLVRDGVRHWRSGCLDCVLAGDFDLMT